MLKIAFFRPNSLVKRKHSDLLTFTQVEGKEIKMIITEIQISLKEIILLGDDVTKRKRRQISRSKPSHR